MKSTCRFLSACLATTDQTSTTWFLKKHFSLTISFKTLKTKNALQQLFYIRVRYVYFKQLSYNSDSQTLNHASNYLIYIAIKKSGS